MSHRPLRRARSVAALLSLTGALVTSALLSPVAGAAPAAKKPVKPAKPALTPSTPVTPGSGYLALGDSFTFGYMEPQVVPAPDYSNAANFSGYPEMLAGSLHLKVVNASCPGETSGSFINTSTPSNGCETAAPGGTAGYRQAYPLHTKYSGSQLSFAVSYLKSHPGVKLVSLQIGGNDLLYCQEATADHCASLTEQAQLLSAAEKNIGTILKAIRTKAGYNGQIVFVGYYPPTAAYDFAIQTFQTAIVNSIKSYKVDVDNPGPAFAAAAAHSSGSLCIAGLETQLGVPGTCGIHPSYAGQALYAQTVLDSIKLG